MDYLFSMGLLGIFIFGLVCLVMVSLAIPYFYVLFRGISKAWHKSKEEERKF